MTAVALILAFVLCTVAAAAIFLAIGHAAHLIRVERLAKLRHIEAMPASDRDFPIKSTDKTTPRR